MLKKIFKTIFIMSLCVGISLPTNAAVSVSDGSAFVTKAEFAADLNNLSNRMAQLENSLDAKIDSLVSSYLTRNGIWNGAKQTVLLDNQQMNPTNWDGYNWLCWFSPLRTTNRSLSSIPCWTVNSKKYKAIEKCTKAGMIILEWNLETRKPSSAGGWWKQDLTGITAGKSNSSNERHIETYLTWYVLTNGTFDMRTRTLCYTLNFPWGVATTLKYTPGMDFGGTLVTFVNKEDDIYFAPEFIMNANEDGITNYLYWNRMGDVGCWCDYFFKCISANIY